MSKEMKLSNYIDQLNEEKTPLEHKGKIPVDKEYADIMKTVRAVKSLKEPEMPDANYERRLLHGISKETAKSSNSKKNIRKWSYIITTAAALFAIVFLLNRYVPNGNSNIVHAMEQAYINISGYHGILQVEETNELGQTRIQSIREVWTDKEGNYYLKELEGSNKGLVTVNNGERKWQIRPEEKAVHLFPTFPDAYQFTFEIGQEIESAKNAIEMKKIREEILSGRETIVYEITPNGGDSYQLWVDKENNMPLQRQTAMQNAIQYTIFYKEIDFIESIPKELMTYNQPDGFLVIDNNPEQIVNNLEEAMDLLGYKVLIPEDISKDYTLGKIGIELNQNRAKLYFETIDKQRTILVQQEKAVKDLRPEDNAMLGKVNGTTAEIISCVEASFGILGGGTYGGTTSIRSIRWQENGYEYSVLGNTSLEELSMFVEGISTGKVELPKETTLTDEPEIQVPVHMEIEENEQKSVDAGHSPWKLDPAFVTQVFASLLIYPNGIEGDYPIQYEEITIIENNGIEAIAEINNPESPAKTVYLKRLIRQDDTGIWTVVGYDQ